VTQDLTGRTAFVTGANRGIGRAIVQGLGARNDLRVVAAARRREDAEAAVAEIGGECHGVALDLSDADALVASARSIEAEHGSIDILVNNAAVMQEGDGLQIGPGEFRHSIEVNAVSPFALIHVFGAGMRDRGWGRVVNVSSDWGSFAEGLGGPIAYSVSKATLDALTVSFARTLGSSVKVNACCPGWVRTRMGGDAATRTPEEGADTPIWLATLPDDGPTGGFFRDRSPMEW
jgi:NAD(P)-dependent dehydrogenase (short-subunit alcohol dehydrogenase family)